MREGKNAPTEGPITANRMEGEQSVAERVEELERQGATLRKIIDGIKIE